MENVRILLNEKATYSSTIALDIKLFFPKKQRM